MTLDAWDPKEPADDEKPELPPRQLTYRDAMAMMESDIPKHKVIMHKADRRALGGRPCRSSRSAP